MKRILTLIAVILSISFVFSSCKKTPEEKLLKAMKPLAEAYLDSCKVTYDSTRVDCVDTITEMSYANLNIALLTEMENNYQMQYEDALINDSTKATYIRLYLGDIRNSIQDFEELMGSGELDAKKVLLYMVTGTMCKGKDKENYMFFVRPDKKTLYTMDPFGNNLLYEEE
ncbi:MAG: hypothetical protein K6A41_03810 [Bacteroidales bacterium]|nr:hypothetical protein [Bacteroidales bacterium]